MRRVIHAILAAALLGAWLTGCSDEPATPAAAGQQGSNDAIVVASFDFTESRIAGEIYAAALAASGYRVVRTIGAGPREVLEPALEQGLVDLLPEYAGTALQFLAGDRARATADPLLTHRRLRAAFAERGIAVLQPAPAQSQNALVVRRDTARRFGLSTVSDLRPVASRMVLGGPPECPERPLCMVGYADVYGLRFRRFAPLDVGGPLTLAALRSGEIDVAVLFTGDRTVLGPDTVFLTDDRGLQPAENLTPVVRQDVLDASGPRLRRRIDDVSRSLTTAALADLVRRVDVEHEDPARVASAWLTRVGTAPTR